MADVAVIVSTYNSPQCLELCLQSLRRQTLQNFEIIVADDGSGESTRATIQDHQRRDAIPIKHLWQQDRGFRKTRILNKAIAATDAPYLVFMDGDCLAHPDFLAEHVRYSRHGAYVNGSLIRLNPRVTEHLKALGQLPSGMFSGRWLARHGRKPDRRFLRLSLPYTTRTRLNHWSKTKLYWLGSNSSCYRDDAIAVNGFDNRFSYGYEDGDFGNRLENYGLHAVTARWTAVLLHLHHDKPWSDPVEIERNRKMMTTVEAGGRYRVEDGLAEVSARELGA